MAHKIWLIGGSRDSIEIADTLTLNTIGFMVSVTTQTAQALYSKDTQIVIGCMNQEKMQSFCEQENIKAIVDASHPYAVEVSQTAIAISTQLNIPYLRYERKEYQTSNSQNGNPLITELDSFKTLLAGDYLRGQRVFLAIGCKALHQFKPWQEQATLYGRVLPKIESLKTALNAGFTSDRLIAIRPPLNLALEKALWQQWKVSLVITKASGKAGGEHIKRQAAAELNIPLIIITRPKVAYPQETKDIQEVLYFCQ